MNEVSNGSYFYRIANPADKPEQLTSPLPLGKQSFEVDSLWDQYNNREITYEEYQWAYEAWLFERRNKLYGGKAPDVVVDWSADYGGVKRPKISLKALLEEPFIEFDDHEYAALAGEEDIEVDRDYDDSKWSDLLDNMEIILTKFDEEMSPYTEYRKEPDVKDHSDRIVEHFPRVSSAHRLNYVYAVYDREGNESILEYDPGSHRTTILTEDEGFDGLS